MSSNLVDEAVYRLDQAFEFLSILGVLIGALPVGLVFALIIMKNDRLAFLKTYFMLIVVCYFAVFQVLLHGDVE